ncbi:MAG TPA: GAF domain-containing sensor histidine kinase [Anaerolineales bacterium]|nr:GAF domain-containing sensor histidine kinase [Anaerolineales bacterium]
MPAPNSNDWQYNRSVDSLLNQIFSFLTAEPGNLFYHFALEFSIGFALYLAFNHWRSSEFPQARRTMLGLGLLLLGQFLLFAFSGLGWQGIINPTAGLPPLDRAFSLFSIILITWLWAFPEPSRIADSTVILLFILILTITGLSLLSWAPQSSITTYNQTIDEWLWQIAALAFLTLGALTLLIRRPNGYWNGLAVLGLMFLGHAGHLIFLGAGNYSGAVRLMYMAAYPILMTLPQRFQAPVNVVAQPRATAVATPTPASSEKQEKDSTPPPAERRRYSTDPKTFHSMLALAAESNPTKISQLLTRAIAQTMLSDLCFLIYLTDNKNQLLLAGGYDLIREDTLEGGSLNKTVIPMLSNAIQRGRPLRMPASSTSADIKGLGEMLGLSNPGHLLSVPIITPEKDILGGLMLLSPYSNRLWTAEDQAFLANIATSVVPIIQRTQKMNRLEQQGEETRQTLEQAKIRIEELEKRSQDLLKQLEESKSNNKVQEFAALMAAQEESQKIIEQLQQENTGLRTNAKGLQTINIEQIEKELRASLEEEARLKNQLAEANAKVLELEKGRSTAKSTEQAEVIASISQELRQPMSSIIGYTDLLLGESVGILGALQRKFVERIKASTERIGNLIEDMIQLNTLETGLADLKPESVDLNAIIDNAMSYTSSQIREKNISIHLDLPKKLSPIHADREALQQILVHLLQNAGSATPVEGTIRLKVETQSERDQDFVLLQVSDTGGGVAAEDIPRVFTRLYRADNVLIQGVGDTGVGLSIAKTLTEAQHGRIWIESEPGAGSTFSVLLPISQENRLEWPVMSKGKK